MAFNKFERDFGKLNNQEQALLYSVENSNGIKFSVTNYGATLVSYWTKNKAGKLNDIVVGFADVSKYESDLFYVGATIGRYAGRIKNAQFKIEQTIYNLAHNENDNILHGGPHSFNKQIWQAKFVEINNSCGVEFSLNSPHQHNGFPGNLDIIARYLLNEDNSLSIEYIASTDQATFINMTNHSYYNLHGYESVLDHMITINGQKFVEVDKQLIPTGNLISLANSAFDFSHPMLLEKSINSLKQSGQSDLDMSYVLNEPTQGDMKLAVDLHCKINGRGLQFYTNQNTAHLFTSPRLAILPSKVNYQTCVEYTGIAIECQNFVDAPNQAHFASALLIPGQTYMNKNLIVPYLL